MESLVVNTVEFPSLWVLVSRKVSSFVLVVGFKHVSISISMDDCLHTVSVVYGTTILDRRLLWDELR